MQVKTKKPQVKTFDDRELKILIKQCPMEVQEYIRSQKTALESQKHIIALAMKKIFDLTKKQ